MCYYTKFLQKAVYTIIAKNNRNHLFTITELKKIMEHSNAKLLVIKNYCIHLYLAWKYIYKIVYLKLYKCIFKIDKKQSFKL